MVTDVILASVILHEDIHSRQDGTQEEGRDVPLSYYANEVRAHRAQLDFLDKAIADMIAKGIIAELSIEHSRIKRYRHYIYIEMTNHNNDYLNELSK